jgi:hypothetical protein
LLICIKSGKRRNIIAKFEAMNLATYAFIVYMAPVSQGIERRYG